MPEKVVITGAAGFVGSQLGYELSQEGYDVLLIDDMSFGYEHNLTVNGKRFGTLVNADIVSDKLEPLFDGAYCVFHLAGISAVPVCQSEPGRAITVNVAGTAHVLEAARRVGVRRLVFASTSAIYENNTKFPCEEDDDVNPTLIYPISKLSAEKLCRAYIELYGMDIAITRYYNVYGPHQDIMRKSPPFVGYVIRELLAGRSPILHSDGRQERDYVFIDDVNELNKLCMLKSEAIGQIFNVASGRAYSVLEMFEIIAGLLDTSVKPTFRTSTQFWDAYPGLFQGKYPLDQSHISKEVDKFALGSTGKAQSVIGWTAKTSIQDGLEKNVNFARSLVF